MGVAAAGFAVGLLLSLVSTGAAEAVTGERLVAGAPVPVAITVANLIGLWAGLVGAAVYASRVAGAGRLSADLGLRVGWWDLPVGAGCGLLSQYVLIPLLYLPFEHADRGISQQLGQPTQRDTGAAHTTAAALVLLIFLAVGAPLVEELFFRGLLLRSLLRELPVPVSIGASAVLFALAHFEAVQFAGLAVFGVVLGLLAWRTGRLGPSIGAHMAFNAAAVVAATHLR